MLSVLVHCADIDALKELIKKIDGVEGVSFDINGDDDIKKKKKDKDKDKDKKSKKSKKKEKKEDLDLDDDDENDEDEDDEDDEDDDEDAPGVTFNEFKAAARECKATCGKKVLK